MPTLGTISNRVGFTKPPRGRALWFTNDVSVRKYSEIVASSTMGNTASETTLATFTVPALALANQGGVRSLISGTVANATSTGTATIRTKLTIGASTVTLAQTSGITLSTSTKSRNWYTEVVVLGTTLSTQLRSANWTAVTAPSTLATAPSTFDGLGRATVTVPNSSASATLKTTVQFSVAHSGVVASVQSGILETLA